MATTTNAIVSQLTCTACSGELLPRTENGIVVSVCAKCDAVHGVFANRLSVGWIVDLRFAGHEPEPEALRFFDVEWDENGERRRSHGWMDRGSRRVVQFG